MYWQEEASLCGDQALLSPCDVSIFRCIANAHLAGLSPCNMVTSLSFLLVGSGQVDKNGALNVADIVLLVNVLLGEEECI